MSFYILWVILGQWARLTTVTAGLGREWGIDGSYSGQEFLK